MQRLTAIILSYQDIGEFDRLYFLYSRENGLVRVKGKGVRKPTAKLAGHLEPGTLSEVYVARSRGMGQITSAITLENFEGLKKKFEKLEEVLGIFRFFAKIFAEGEKDEKIFDLLLEFLSVFGKTNSAEEKMLSVAFWWKLFDSLGNRPEIVKCAACSERLEEKGRKFFSSARGGIVCKKCFSGDIELNEISANQIKLLRVFLANSLQSIIKIKADEKELEGLGRIKEAFRKYNF